MYADYTNIVGDAAQQDFSDFRSQCFVRVTGTDKENRPVVVLSAGDLCQFYEGMQGSRWRCTSFGLLMLDAVVNHPYVIVYFDADRHPPHHFTQQQQQYLTRMMGRQCGAGAVYRVD